MAGKTRTVVIVVYDNALLLDVASSMQVFSTYNMLLATPEQPAYSVRVVSARGGLVSTSAGLPLHTEPLPDLSSGRAAIDTLIVCGGAGRQHAVRDDQLLGWVRAAAPSARRVCSVCSGAFVLAAAGLLARRRATTHWKYCAELREKYPQVTVDEDSIFVRDGKYWTSAGVTAGIDLMLALVKEDHGHARTMEVARHMVVFMKRPGGQSQFSQLLAGQSVGRESFSDLIEWITEHLDEELDVERLAERAHMSPRHFTRVFRQQMHCPPAKFVERVRIETARRLLEETPLQVTAVAQRCGFGDEERMRRAFLRQLKVSPSAYRERFRDSRGQAAAGASA
jgi:transcriptional regulator GlxA family with amidase domain